MYIHHSTVQSKHSKFTIMPLINNKIVVKENEKTEHSVAL